MKINQSAPTSLAVFIAQSQASLTSNPSIASTFAERAEDIDLQRAESAGERARDRLEEFGVKVESDLRKAVKDADAVNVLRIQLERQKTSMFPSLDEYSRVFGVDDEVLKAAKPDCIVMHPGPMNRGIEISQDVADGDRAVILEQVTNGVAVRMAVLYLLSGGEAPENASEQETLGAVNGEAEGK